MAEQLKLFTFEYEVISEKRQGTWSFKAESETEARAKVQERIADFEFVEVDDIRVGILLDTKDAKDVYYECEGCT